MAIRRLITAVAFIALLGGPSVRPPAVALPRSAGAVPADAVAELDAGIDAMKALSIHRDELDWDRIRGNGLRRLAAAPHARAADADSALAGALPQLGDRHSSLQTPSEA